MQRTRSLNTEDYYPEFVKAVLPRIESSEPVALVGFGENLKWLARILSERNQNFAIHDHRSEFVGYDCCRKTVRPLDEVSDGTSQVVVCFSEFNLVSGVVQILVVHPRLASIPTLTYLTEHRPWMDQLPYSHVFERATQRAQSVNSPGRLFNLLQLVEQTVDVDGDVVEFGTFAGGTAAILCEGLAEWAPQKHLLLFDSYEGLPASPLGVDARWQGAFANVSRKEVERRFEDKGTVHLITGDILDNLHRVPERLSLVHVDVDTYHAAQKVTEHIWPRLSPGGVVLFDDYGFFPNCAPLTVFVSEFAKRMPHAFRFYLPSNGFLMVKA